MMTPDHAPVYLLINRYREGEEGVIYPEMTRAALVKDIAEGGQDILVQVFELHEGRYRDISRDIADEIVNGWHDLTVQACADFINRHGHNADAIVEGERESSREWSRQCSGHVRVL